MEPYISGSEEEVRRREVYMYYGLLVKVAELKLFTSELKLSVKGFRIYKPNSPAQPGGHSPKEPKLRCLLQSGTFSKAMVSLCEMTLANWPTPSRVLTEKPDLRLDLPSFLRHQRKVVSGVKKHLTRRNKSKIWPETHILCTFGAKHFKAKKRKTCVVVVDYGRIGRFFVQMKPHLGGGVKYVFQPCYWK